MTNLANMQNSINSGDMRRAAAFVMASKWAITPEALLQVCAIASGCGDLNALTKESGSELEGNQGIEMRGTTAIIGVKGPLFRYANLFTQVSGATSYQMFAKDLHQALQSADVENIILDIDSPGGMVNGMTETAEMIFKARSIKPVYAHIGGAGASAAYGLASGATKIFAEKSAIVGSIGVVASYQSGDDGVIEIVSSNAPNKRPDLKSEEGRAVIQKELDSLEKVFVEQVAQSRGVSVDTVLSDFGRGGVFVGEEAKLAGMVDGIDSLESLIAGISGDNKEVFTMSDKKSDSSNAPEITASFIAANHPDVAEELRAEGRNSVDLEAAKEEGKEIECNRIRSVFGASLPGHEELITKLAFDGKSDAGAAALAVLSAEKSSKASRIEAISTDLSEAPDSTVVEPVAAAADDWDKDENLRAEFGGDKDAYLAYQAANDSGRIKTLGGN